MYDKATNQAIFYVSIMNSFSSYIVRLLGIKRIEPKVIGFMAHKSAVNKTLLILSLLLIRNYFIFLIIEKNIFHLHKVMIYITIFILIGVLFLQKVR